MAEGSPLRRRPGQHHKRSSSLSWLVDLISSDARPPEPQVKPFDPEEMTKQERISRMLHAPHTHQARRADALLFEHFLVWRWPGPGEEQPQLVLAYPLGKPPEIPGLADFCFPAGCVRRKAGEEGARTEFVFMLTTDDGPLFGMVVHGPLEPYPLCLCMLSRLPLFRLHFELLDSIYAASVDVTRRSLGSGDEPAASSPPPSVAHLHSRSVSSPLLTPLPLAAVQPAPGPSSPASPPAASPLLAPTPVQRFKSDLSFVEAPKRPSPSPSPFASSGGPASPAPAELTPRERVRKILKAYRKVQAPEQGKSVHFYVPHDPRLIQFKRPHDDEDDDAELLADYAAATLWSVLSRRSLLTLVAAVLLEKKVALYALRERTVAACALGLLPMLRPFRYQASFIPLLPTRLHSFLEAPVPFLVGVVELPARDQLPAEVILLNLDADTFLQGGDSLPALPEEEELDQQLRSVEKQFKKISSARLKPSAALSVEQSQLLARMGRVLQDHFVSCLGDYRRHCIRDMTDKAKPITVFLKDSFLAEASDEDRPFYTAFFDTQTWFHYSDRLLRSADAHEHTEP